MTCGKPCNCPSYRDHLLSIGFGASSMPTRHPEAVAATAREARWQRDMPAYKALREQNTQPRGIDGCADLAARAEDKLEVETGQIMTKAQASTAKAVMAELGMAS